jgi:hypothetical protein
MTQPTDNKERDELVRVIREIATQLGTDSVARPDFLRRSGTSERRVQRLFGSYNGLVEAAGLVPNRFPTPDAPTYSDGDMLAEVTRLLRLPGSKLTTIHFEQNSKMSLSAVQRRFGGWINVLKAAAEGLDPGADAALLNRIREYTAPAISPAANALAATGANPTAEDEDAQENHVAAAGTVIAGGNIYGDFINFRGLQHAPVNEQGVVFLFGMICRELGYVVEIVRPGFPDCEAKRQIKTGMWQRVRIEFEFRSRTFRTHGHDPDQCDMIVCWEDNWPDCPLEVLELRSAIQRLSPTMKTP